MYWKKVGYLLGAIVTVSQAKLHRYEFNITSGEVNPDCSIGGVETPHINGQFPGPPIYVQTGDELEITVRNKMTALNTTIHYHGIRQLGSVRSDGVPGVTQDPILPGNYYIQRFKVTQQAGTYFYHAHVGLQDDSVQGSFIVYESDTANPKKVPEHALLQAGPYRYKKDLVLQLSEWWHEPLVKRQGYYTTSNFAFDRGSDSILMNGRTVYNATQATMESCQGYTTFDVEPNSTYRLRVIGANSFRTLALAIKEHNMTMMEVDGGLIHPYETSYLEVTPGQRFSVLLKTGDHPPGSTFAIGTSYLWRQRGRGVTENGFGYIRYIEHANATDENSTLMYKPILKYAQKKKNYLGGRFKSLTRAIEVAQKLIQFRRGDRGLNYKVYSDRINDEHFRKYNDYDKEEEDEDDCDEDDDNDDYDEDDDNDDYDEEDDEDDDNDDYDDYDEEDEEDEEDDEYHVYGREVHHKVQVGNAPTLGTGVNIVEQNKSLQDTTPWGTEKNNTKQQISNSHPDGLITNNSTKGPPLIDLPIANVTKVGSKERVYADLPLFPLIDEPDWVWRKLRPLEERDPILDEEDVRTILFHTSTMKTEDNVSHYVINHRLAPVRRTTLVKSFSKIQNQTYTDDMDQYNEALGTYRLEHNEIVDFVFQNTKNGGGGCLLHPWHTHGHSHYVIASGAGNYVHERDEDIRNFEYPLLKDTTVAYPSVPTKNADGCGWTKVRIIADNPGFWAVHCHITTHMIQGKMIVLEEAPELISKYNLYPYIH